MTSVFVPPALITDPRTIADNGKSFLENELPGWRRTGSNPIDFLFDYFSISAGEQAEVLSSELTSAFRSLGSLRGIPPLEAVAATALATFTVKDTAGYLIEAGITVGIRDSGGQLQGFRLNAPLRVEPGGTTAQAVVEALEVGEAGNDLGGVAELIVAPAFLTEVSLASSGGGEEAESDEDYLDRLTEDFEAVPPGATNGQSAAAVARQIPGIVRATAVNLLKPAAADGGEGSEETKVEACVTVAAASGDGTAASSGARALAKAKLEEGAVANLRFFVVAPHYEKIDATIVASAWPGLDLAVVEAAIEEAVARELSPATAQTDSTGSSRRWANDPVVRLADLYAQCGTVAGLRFVTSILIGAHGGSLTAADHILVPASKIPALPEVGTISVTVNPTH